MKDDSEWFIIDNIVEFIESTRTLIFNTFGKTNEQQLDKLSFIISELDEEERDELDRTLTQEECMVISKEFIITKINKKTKEKRYTISTDRYMKMIESFNTRMISNLLRDLTNKGILESAYDSESNDFVFWLKDNDKIQEKPETD